MLVTYCENNISQDHVFSGELNQKFSKYKAFVKQYVERILPYINEDDFCESVAEFNNLFSLEYMDPM